VLQYLLLGPWRTSELAAAASQAGLPLTVDEGGRLGAGLGVVRAPTVVFLLDGRPLTRLEWPFTEAELGRGVADLAAAPRGGPRQLLGAEVSLGTRRALDTEPVDLDGLSRSLLVLFFNPLCPPCWDALPGLVELREETTVVLVMLATHALTESDQARLRETELQAVLDDDGELAQRFGLRVTPTYVILNQQGVIRWVHEGVVEPEELRRALSLVAGGGREP
jgi:thiol-disulfide isomerase/thioredoxin